MVSRESSDAAVSLCPSLVRNEMPVVYRSKSPESRGWKMCEVGRDEYFDDFLALACSAAPHGLAEIVSSQQAGQVLHQ